MNTYDGVGSAASSTLPPSRSTTTRPPCCGPYGWSIVRLPVVPVIRAHARGRAVSTMLARSVPDTRFGRSSRTVISASTPSTSCATADRTSGVPSRCVSSRSG
ncbi:hypothetical protein CHO01_09880 [Cellulomonas hominis]|uniref:Uncharacterized protein n=1 Tax=Cellulomonas hominis TaxID=156981 RepID=A0A511F9E8_9CELL|nr:hypothetical protein CHO01_09880 [Cellulomonas hominis]